MTHDIPELTAHLGYWLRQLSNHVSQAFARKVTAKGVTVAEWAMMRMLYRNTPISPSQLAAEMGMTRGAISKLADRLVSKSLVVREAHASDARAQTLRLTEKGAVLVPQLAALADQNETESFSHLSGKDYAALQRILKGSVMHLGITATPLE